MDTNTASPLASAPRRMGWQRARRWGARVGLVFVALVVFAVVAGALYQSIGERRDLQRFPPPGQMVDVGGFQLHLACTGAGAPTVILESGLGSNFLTWAAVQPEVAAFTRVCSYDRAGMGWSDRGPRPRTVGRMADELSVLLENAALDAPYVLVGHSLGGLIVRQFAFAHPDHVSGLVLVDPSHEDQLMRLPPNPWFLDVAVRGLTTLAPFGLARLFGDQITAPDAPTVSPETRAMEVAGSVRTNALRTVGDEYAVLGQSSEEVRHTRRPLEDIPLVVLSARLPDATPGGADIAAQSRRVMRELHEQIVRSSARGTLVIAENSGHVIQASEPALIVDAIRQLAAAVGSAR